MTSSGEGTFLGLIATLLSHPRLLLFLPLAGGLGAGALTLARGPQYVAIAELKPATRDSQLSGFTGIAQQFGVSLDNLGASEGPEYFSAVLRSNEILGEVVDATYRFSDRELGESAGDSIRGSLMEIWEIEGDTWQERRASAIRLLRSSMNARPNLAAGLVRLEVTARWPELAVGLNRRFLVALDSFNVRSRRSQAAAQRTFVEARLAEMRAELTAAEDTLVAYESQNRMAQSPDLLIERQRLQRRVDIATQVYMTLAQGFEQARIDEVRDTPVVTVVDAPENTVEEAGGFLLFVSMGGFVGLLLGLALVFFKEEWARQSVEHPDHAEAVRAAWGQLVGGLGLRRRRADQTIER